MGNVPLPTVHKDVTSLTEPNKKSCVSDSLEDFIDSFDMMWHGITQALRDPRAISGMAAFNIWCTKSLQVIDHEDKESFTVKLVTDLDKIAKSFNISLPLKESKSKYVVKVSKAQRIMIYTKYIDLPREWKNGLIAAGIPIILDDEGFVVECEDYVRFHTDPLRAEMWRVKGGTRLSGPLVQADLAHWLCVCSMEQKAKVKVLYDVVSNVSGGKVVLSDPVDEYFTYEEFFRELCDAMKKKSLRQFFAGAKDISIKEVSETESEATITYPPQLPPGQQPSLDTTNLTIEVLTKSMIETGEITVVSSFNGTLYSTSFYNVHRNPVRVEVYTALSDGTRTASRQDSHYLLLLVNGLVTSATEMVMF